MHKIQLLRMKMLKFIMFGLYSAHSPLSTFVREPSSDLGTTLELELARRPTAYVIVCLGMFSRREIPVTVTREHS